MKTTIKQIEKLENEVPYTLFNRGGVKFNEKFLDEVVLEHGHETTINGITFIAYHYNAEETSFCFSVKMRGSTTSRRSNLSQIRTK